MATTGTIGATAWLADDAEILDELRAVGALVEPVTGPEGGTEGVRIAPPADAARVDALASVLMGRIARVQAELTAHGRTYDAEHAALQARFARRIEPLDRELKTLGAWVRALAEQQAAAGAWGKKRSRDTGGGTYGVRTVPAKLEVTDVGALAAELAERAPDLVRVTVKLPLAEARQYLTDAELAEAKRDVPAKPLATWVAEQASAPLPSGLRQVPERVEPYFNPLPLVAQPEASRG